MATISIDKQPFEADPSKNLLQVALTLGFDLPYFCWHPALGSVGACRQCAVKQFKDENDTRGRLVMACMLPAVDGTRISIADPEAREFRASVIEWLMTNHPHDCPVCDEGGECHLQDMTVMTGHAYRRFRFSKRTFRNQYLGPFINHEMNRCITCYRCVRFYKEYAGGDDLDAFGCHNHVYFGRHEEGVLENEFSGNLVEVCPTGVFTDKTLKEHYTRKWDLTMAPSVCVHCGLGCNTIPGERYGRLRRILNRYNGEVNGYFLCDRGRFGYEFVNDPRRIRQPLWRKAPRGALEPAANDELLQHLGPLLAIRESIIGIGSPRASLEANFVLRALVGRERFFNGMSESEAALVAEILSILTDGPASSPSLHEIEQADAVLVLGEDVTNTAPRMALSLRQAVRQQPMKAVDALKVPRWHDEAARDIIQENKGPLFIAFPGATRLDDVARRTYRAAPQDVARLGFAAARALDTSAPEVPGLSDEVQELASGIADALQKAERPLVIAGVSLGSEALIQAAANVAWALCKQGKPCALSYVTPEANSLGLALLGGGNLSAAVRAVEEGAAETLVVLENDLFRRAGESVVNRLLAARHTVVIDSLESSATARAEAVLPAGTFAESDGTFVSSEGRAQRFFQVFPPQPHAQESWRWLRDLMAAAGRAESSRWQALDDVLAAIGEELPELRPIIQAAPPADFRVAQQKFSRAPRRFSGRTAITAHADVHEPNPPEDADSPLTFTMEGCAAPPPPALISHYWATGWNSVQALNKFQSEVGGPLAGGDPGVRLIEPAEGAKAAWFTDVPPPFTPRAEEFLVIPLYHIFGSEELSILAPAIAERAPKPYLALNPADAQRLGVTAGDEVRVQVAEKECRLPVTISAELPQRTTGLPVGLPGLTGISLPMWGKLEVTAS
jgi:NADH-quinone oxidoreductase subunit G